ncbi:uncharacterized protein LOC129378778 isoform X2 [Poeciliopsis prolifica]|uniref:uncharacterized protein LOC129378778 isoform X2 n=1 Tax=Poeciliopsis prolifica TaxID=188132 RepID=UPI002413FE04|nr:uncharacterized protein LOC129378778 isoform X2 [Poeciliopsis prolifica]
MSLLSGDFRGEELKRPSQGSWEEPEPGKALSSVPPGRTSQTAFRPLTSPPPPPPRQKTSVFPQLKAPDGGSIQESDRPFAPPQNQDGALRKPGRAGSSPRSRSAALSQRDVLRGLSPTNIGARRRPPSRSDIWNVCSNARVSSVTGTVTKKLEFQGSRCHDEREAFEFEQVLCEVTAMRNSEEGNMCSSCGEVQG